MGFVNQIRRCTQGSEIKPIVSWRIAEAPKACLLSCTSNRSDLVGAHRAIDVSVANVVFARLTLSGRCFCFLASACSSPGLAHVGVWMVLLCCIVSGGAVSSDETPCRHKRTRTHDVDEAVLGHLVCEELHDACPFCLEPWHDQVSHQ